MLRVYLWIILLQALDGAISDILEATDLIKGGLYGHFKNKEAIWYEAYNQAVNIWKGIVFKNLQKIDDPIERIVPLHHYSFIFSSLYLSVARDSPRNLAALETLLFKVFIA